MDKPGSAIGIGILRIVGLYAACASAWILFSDQALCLLFHDPAEIAFVGTLKGWLFVAVTSVLLLILLKQDAGRWPQPRDVGGADGTGVRPWRLIAAFASLSLVLVILGVTVYGIVADSLRNRENEQLGTIAEFKKDQIENWMANRRSDLLSYMENPFYAGALTSLRTGFDETLHKQLVARLERTRTVRGYAGIEMLDTAGQVVAAAGEACRHGAEFQAAARQAFDQSEPVLLDLHRAGPGEPVRLAYLAAIKDARRPERPSVGLAVFTIDPDRALYPMLGAWPTKSNSGVTLLVRRDGDHVVFLSDLRLRDDKPLTLRLPLTRRELPAVQAVTRGSGIYEGRDYREQPVLTAVRPVAGTPWMLVAKIDQEEIFAGVRFAAWVCGGLIAAGIMVVGALLVMAWRQQRLRDRIAQLDLLDRFTKVSASVPGVICSFRLEPDGKTSLPYASPMIADLFGLAPEEVAGDAGQIFSRMAAADADRVMGSVTESARTMESWHDEFRFNHPVKGERWIEGHSVPKREADGSILWHGYLHDVTERKLTEIALGRANRMLRARNLSNLALLHASDEVAYLQNACRIIVEVCGHTMMWIGSAENGPERRVQPMAAAGFEEGYLEAIRITWADDEHGRGPTGTAIRSRRPMVCQDMTTDPRFEPWRDEAARRGYRSSVALPLIAGTEVLGALTLYASEPEAFPEGELERLGDITNDIAYGISFFRLRAAHGRAEAELADHRQHLEDLVVERTRQLQESNRLIEERAAEIADLYNNAPCGYHSLDPSGLFVRINDTELSWLGYRRDEVVGKLRFSDLLDTKGKRRFANNMSRFLEQGHLYDLEYELSGKNGHSIPVLLSATTIRDDTGAFMMSRSVLYNIKDIKEAEKAASRHAKLAEAFFEHSVACLVVLDRDYNFLRVNAAYAKACRQEIGDYTGRNHFEMYPSDTKLIFDEVVRTKRPFETFTRAFEFPDQPERGTTYWDWTLVPVLDQCGEIEYLVFSLNEVTERKRAEVALQENEAKYRTLFDQSPDGIILIDPETTRPIEFNASAHLTLGYSREEFSALSLADINALHTEDGIRNLADAISRKGGDDFETLHKARDGELRNRSISVRTLEFQGRTVHHAIWRDITERKQAEAELQRYRDGLEALVAERTVALRESNRQLAVAKDRAEAANRAKSTFLANMSHELRTPLSAILGFSQLLDFDQDDSLSDDRKLCINHILENGKHLLALINDLLDLAKIDAGQVTISLERVVLTELLSGLEASLPPLADGAGITVSVCRGEKLPAVRADKTRLNQVLLNLGTNAIKYNRPHGRVDITCEVSSPDRVRLVVTDTGHGIPEERQHEVFEPFNRLGRETSAIEGTGVGLSLSRKLMHLMGGTLDFSSRSGKGSRFWIDIPVHGPATELDKISNGTVQLDAASKITFDRNRTLLCVDDNSAARELVAKIVANLPGVRFLTAETAEAGIERARQCRPDLILMDINLPGMDGIAALAELRRYAETRDVPVFALSSSASATDIDRGLAAGFAKYLTKPYDVHDLLAAITEKLAEVADNARVGTADR